MDLYEKDLFGQDIKPEVSSVVAKRFGFPPFTVLDAKTGEWQDRKRAWSGLGIRGEVGRDAKAYNCHKWIEDNREEMGLTGSVHGDGVSIFDPVLCEMSYRWFSPVGGVVVDPFAGGSVRGIVAGAMGRNYWGCDLRAEQVVANVQQAQEIKTPTAPTWVCGDSLVMLDHAPEADLIFSCPPYGDLEVYSELPEDLSAMEWPEFLDAYDKIVAKAVGRLKMNRFACFVVGDFRDPRGNYRNFVGKTTDAFVKAGCHLYNEAVLLTSVGSACMRVSKQFTNSRKFAKTHQNILVFVKGDGKKAADACGLIEEA